MISNVRAGNAWNEVLPLFRWTWVRFSAERKNPAERDQYWEEPLEFEGVRFES